MECSHILIAVSELRQAVADYERAGFSVKYATSPEKAQHAHVWFPEGPVIELLCPPRNAYLFELPISLVMGRGAGRRMVRWSRQREGFCDLSVRTPGPDPGEQLARLRGQGVPMGRPVRWTRTKPDGRRTSFRFVYPRDDRLPFVVTPYDPPQHPEAAEHPNGALGVTAVEVGVAPGSRAAFSALTGDDPLYRVRTAPATGVLSLEIAGLSAPPDPALLHGARLVPATEPPGEPKR